MFNIVSTNFWVVFIIVTIANALIMKQRSKQYIQKDQSLQSGYEKLFKGYIFWGNIPWLIMGAGILMGGVPSIWHYFRPMDGNPFVIGWFVSVFIIWLIGTYWLFIKDGADFLVRHPGVFNIELKSASMVKGVWVLCLIGVVIGMVMMVLNDFSIPNIR